MHMAGEGRVRGKIPLDDDRTSRQVIQITCAGETSPKTASQNSLLPFSSARAAMADAGINFFNFHGMAWLSRVSTATCCGVSLAPFVRVRQRSKQRARALRCAARVARGTEAEACILVRIPLHDELGEQLF